MNWKLAAALLVCSYGGWDWWAHRREIARPVGICAPDEPRQTQTADATPFMHAGFQIMPLADYEITARLLHKTSYRTGLESSLAPVDFAMGWGRMSDTAVLREMKLRQNFRFLLWSCENPPIPLAEITAHAANMHLVPADQDVRTKLAGLLPGEVVRLQGQLIDATKPDGWHWTSSLSRTDSGGGACELMFVRGAEAVR